MPSDDQVGNGGFGYSEIADELWTEIIDVEDAHGDVKAAEERLRLPKQQLDAAEQALAAKHERLSKRVAELNLAGREINFESGTSQATVHGTGMEDLSVIPEKISLKGVAGTILGAEAGTLLGRKVAEDDTVVLHVKPNNGSAPLQRSLIIHADKAVYSIEGALPKDSEDPQES
jgi:hypothetical protein